jgi:hypothetical protein
MFADEDLPHVVLPAQPPPQSYLLRLRNPPAE